ncbi:MAG: glycosyltransferase family 4 protein [Candidatus Omnitrophica bacterium]|nr:glycosyltransferase family 4 protein [Candidatus Omnitrophota bacterium]
MRIGYCIKKDVLDRSSWSGTHYYIYKALEKYSGVIVPFGPLNNRYLYLLKILNRISSNFFRKSFNINHTKLVSKEYARVLKKKISEEKLDILFFPAGGALSAYLETNIPMVSLMDATCSLLFDYYEGYKNLFSVSKKRCIHTDKKALQRSILTIYCSDWAANSAINEYGIDKSKIHVIPLGANIEEAPKRKDVLEIRKVTPQVCKLLFIGVDWERKGGEIAYQTMVELNRRGIETELIICGVTPPAKFISEKVRIEGYLNKNNKKEFSRLCELYKEASFFILPTRSECAGVVFCEAAAFALPILAANTGGVATYVGHEKNGYLLPLDYDGVSYADKIEELWKNKNEYQEFCRNSRNKFEEELNWDKWGERVASLLKKL